MGAVAARGGVVRVGRGQAGGPVVGVGRVRMASTAALQTSEIQSRILDVLKGFDKANADKISPSADFANDLGLDSLDAVEVVMAIEEEFSVEIPDAEADGIKSVGQAIEYISKQSDAH